ncbi:hypothetical protein CFP56_006628 [Quercus suber]|uniref:Uncharacterized protein n=1 Tax=Quercus suber TaxID=58331 RepID=A0AAW0L929_QUESU
MEEDGGFKSNNLGLQEREPRQAKSQTETTLRVLSKRISFSEENLFSRLQPSSSAVPLHYERMKIIVSGKVAKVEP